MYCQCISECQKKVVKTLFFAIFGLLDIFIIKKKKTLFFDFCNTTALFLVKKVPVNRGSFLRASRLILSVVRDLKRYILEVSVQNTT